MEVQDPDLVATVYHLINADVVDTDGDGLSDNLSLCMGQIHSPDTDGDGENIEMTTTLTWIIEEC